LQRAFIHSFIHSGYLYSALQETYSEALSVQLYWKTIVQKWSALPHCTALSLALVVSSNSNLL